MRELTREQARAIDRRALEQLGLPGALLMENAGSGAAAILRQRWERRPSPAPGERVVILCGRGNNGGDGYVVARHLHNAGIPVALVALGGPPGADTDAALQRRVVERMGLELADRSPEAARAELAVLLEGAALVVDGILGTGFRGSLRPELARLLGAVQELRGPLGFQVVALDVPTGLDCDTGRASEGCLRADLTLTFVAPKVGFRSALEWVGELQVVSIGTPPEWLEGS